MSQSEDIDAINRYMMATSARNIVSTNAKNDWVAWYDKLGWYGKNYDSSVYDVARNKRNAFNLSNVSSLEEEQQVKDVIKNGMTTEQMLGLPDRRDSNGMFPLPPPSTSITWVYLIGGVALLGVVGYTASSVARVIGR